MQRIFIVRHGQSKANAAKQVCGQIDSPLTQLGKEQAKKAGQDARSYNFDLIVTSPLMRAKETAQIIARQIGYNPKNIIVLEELIERFMGRAEGLSYAESPLLSGNFEAIEQMSDLEPFETVYRRARLALTIIKHYQHKKILIVCHNTVGRMLKTVAQHEEPLAMYDQPRLENGTIYPL